jgi:hypothetical protein
MERDAIVVTFTPTLQMYYRGYLALNKGRIIRTGAVLLLLSAAGMSLTWTSANFSYALAMAIVLCLILPAEFFLLTWLKLRGLMKEPSLAGEVTMTISDDCLAGKNRSIDSRCEWPMFTKYIERSDTFVLRAGKKHTMVIPKNAFEDQDDLARFRELLASKIGR